MTPPAAPRVAPVDFWNDKILGWEESRYAPAAAAPSLLEHPLLERIAGRAASSLRFRLHAALTLLAPHVRGRHVVELGCGSGLLAGPLMALGVAGYRGIDISPVAIARARERATAAAFGAKVNFAVAAAAELEPQGGALIFSLGLFDWLSAAEIDHVLAVGAADPYLHAVAERRRSVQQLVHRLYVHLSYGRRTGLAPRYHRIAEIAAAVRRHHPLPPNVFRDPRMSFGVFVTDLPLPATALPDPVAGMMGAQW